MSSRTHTSRAGKRVPELRMPYPLLEEVLFLPGDYLKILLRLMQLAAWKPTEVDGVRLDAGETLIAYRSPALWNHLSLGPERRNLSETGRVALMARAVRRLREAGLIETRSARPTATKSATGRATQPTTAPTIVRFMKFRDILWPGNVDATRGAQRDAQRDAPQGSDTIPSEDPSDPSASRERADAPGGGARTPPAPALAEVTAFQERLAAAFLEVKGATYEHADPGVEAADRLAAEHLLQTSTTPDRVLEVWRSAIRRRVYPRIHTIADLARHWAALAPPAEAPTCGNGAQRKPGVTPKPSGPEAGFLEMLGSRVRTDIYARWIVPLHASSSGDELELTAPDQFHQAFLDDNYRPLLEGAWCAHRGLKALETGQRVRLRCAQPQPNRA